MGKLDIPAIAVGALHYNGAICIMPRHAMSTNPAIETRGNASQNPLYKRLTSGSKPPTVRQTMLAGLCLFVVATVLVLKQPHLPIMRPLYIAAVCVVLLVPAVIAGMAGALTATDTQHEAFTLQTITTLSRSEVVSGYSRAVLFRARLLLAIAVGLLPIVASSSLQLSASSDCVVFVSEEELTRFMPGQSCVPHGEIIQPLIDLGQAALHLTGVIPGVFAGIILGLRMKQPAAAGATSILLAAILSTLYFVSLPKSGGATTTCLSNTCTTYYPWPEPLWLPIGMLVIVLLTLGFAWLARRAV
jgi:hypothetical protein